MNRLLARRRAAEAALADVRHRERTWASATRGIRAWAERHRAGVIVGGGFAAGFTTSLLPVAPLLRLASALAGTVSLMVEGPFLRFLAAQHENAEPPATS